MAGWMVVLWVSRKALRQGGRTMMEGFLPRLPDGIV